jgi:hypothetical protein
MLDIIVVIFGIGGQLILCRKNPNVFLANCAYFIANVCGVVFFTVNFNPWFLFQFGTYLVLSFIGIKNNRKKTENIISTPKLSIHSEILSELKQEFLKRNKSKIPVTTFEISH